jgi:hypothetical protein
LLRSLTDLSTVIAENIKQHLTRAPYISLEQDGWSKQHQKFIGTTAGGPGKKFFLSCYNIEGSETAQMQALGMHKATLKALDIPPDLPIDDPSIPLSKVSNLTTDSAAVMQSTADIRCRDYRLFKDTTWTPCSVHFLNLALQDQVGRPSSAC